MPFFTFLERETKTRELQKTRLVQRVSFRNLTAIHFLASAAGGIQHKNKTKQKKLTDLINYTLLVIKLGSASPNRHQRYRIEEKHQKSQRALSGGISNAFTFPSDLLSGTHAFTREYHEWPWAGRGFSISDPQFSCLQAGITPISWENSTP